MPQAGEYEYAYAPLREKTLLKVSIPAYFMPNLFSFYQAVLVWWD